METMIPLKHTSETETVTHASESKTENNTTNDIYSCRLVFDCVLLRKKKRLHWSTQQQGTLKKACSNNYVSMTASLTQWAYEDQYNVSSVTSSSQLLSEKQIHGKKSFSSQNITILQILNNDPPFSHTMQMSTNKVHVNFA